MATACAAGGGRLVTNTVTLVECTMPMGDSFKENMYRALLVEQRGASNPDFHYQWTFIDSPEGTLATAHTWIEHQNAFGKTTRDDVGPGMAGNILRAAVDAWNTKHPQGGAVAAAGPATSKSVDSPTRVSATQPPVSAPPVPAGPAAAQTMDGDPAELMSAKAVAAKQQCSNVRRYGTGYRATCNSFDLVMECVGGSCQPVHTMRSDQP
ncbi:hypothetical protein HBF26_13390 [Luteibacter jiangsuensis]|uniref:Lipoprotein n=1 Tax=Luteibacter jiangsuensis TaxID=637577 RepID=A0ABX0Q5R4_9GAMM|nr:hypothetical protein [Luteibacter jiangsuensis]NID05888.1 hypothetical protein [Luteibacter jiangsuensis]